MICGLVKSLKIEKHAGEPWKWQVLLRVAGGERLLAGNAPDINATFKAIKRNALRCGLSEGELTQEQVSQAMA